MTGADATMTIGEFARRSGLTPKALRLYDDLGLLSPAEVDQHSGYRRYASSQLAHARLVATLRLLGMPLARITQILDLPGSCTAREVEAYWSQVEADTATRRRIVATLIHQLRNEEPVIMRATDTLPVAFGTSHRRGHRDRQQDALLATPELMGIADGFGDRDDVAKAALAAFAANGLDGAIAEVAPEVNAALPDQPASGTTLTAVAIVGTTAHITHLGDGRVWLVRSGVVRQLTHDHTVVAALLESGQLTPEEARSHEHRTLLNRALAPGAVADRVSVELLAGDRLVLTTDGVHRYVDDLEVLLGEEDDPQQVAETVAAAVREAGEPDNHSIVVADFARSSSAG